MDIIEETQAISDYMAVSDILVTKAGSASFCEAIHMNLPMILDAVSSTLVWERFNHKFTLMLGLGSVMKRYAELPLYLEHYIQNPELLADIRHNMSLLSMRDTPDRFRTRVVRMLRPSLKYGNLAFAYDRKSRLE
jgi:UDP-N-acetylglucosamine:LPS N-acetylglucosamine transferase